MALTVSSIQDLVNGTLNDLGRYNIQQVAQNDTRYPIFGTLFGPERSSLSDGAQIQRTLMNVVPDSARPTGLYSVDQVNVQDVTQIVTVPWRQFTTNWAFDKAEILTNRGASKIFDIMQPRREGAKLAMCEMLEQQAWSSPTSSSDTEALFGIPYWIVKNSTTGFNGGAPTGHTLVGNLNPSTVNNWKNYTIDYDTVTKADLLAKLRTGLRKCNFTNVTNLKEYREMRKTYRLYVNESTLASLELIGESQNENLGRDLAPYDGASGKGLSGVAEFDGDLTFRRKPLIYTPTLDDDSTNPVYGIDHSTFFAYVLKGMNMDESRVMEVAGQHTVYCVHIDLRTNLVCVDRRRNFVAYVAS